jgi:hypothetical protein
MHNGDQVFSLSQTMRENTGGFIGLLMKKSTKGISDKKGEWPAYFHSHSNL